MREVPAQPGYWRPWYPSAATEEAGVAKWNNGAGSTTPAWLLAHVVPECMALDRARATSVTSDETRSHMQSRVGVDGGAGADHDGLATDRGHGAGSTKSRDGYRQRMVPEVESEPEAKRKWERA